MIDPELDDLWKGIITDFYRADIALRLFDALGEHAKQINDATFGRFFGAVQTLAQRDMHISGCLFELQKGGYRIRSIPSMLAWLDSNADTTTVHNREALIKYIDRHDGVAPRHCAAAF